MKLIILNVAIIIKETFIKFCVESMKYTCKCGVELWFNNLHYAVFASITAKFVVCDWSKTAAS